MTLGYQESMILRSIRWTTLSLPNSSLSTYLTSLKHNGIWIKFVMTRHPCHSIYPISPTTPYRFIRHFDKWATYTVNSGYYVASHLNRVSEPLHWKNIWKLHIPPKVCEFLWRVLRNVLPTKYRLQQCGISIDTTCDCGASDEDLNHALLTCHKARVVWQKSGKCETTLSLLL